MFIIDLATSSEIFSYVGNADFCGLYYNSVTIVATIVTQISQVISHFVQKFKNDQDDPAYLGYDRSYDRNMVKVQATDVTKLFWRNVTLCQNLTNQRGVRWSSDYSEPIRW